MSGANLPPGVGGAESLTRHRLGGDLDGNLRSGLVPGVGHDRVPAVAPGGRALGDWFLVDTGGPQHTIETRAGDHTSIEAIIEAVLKNIVQ